MMLSTMIPAVCVPEGSKGDWRVERFRHTKFAATMSSVKDGHRYCPEGEYTRLIRGRTCVMSDVPAEKRDHLEFVLKAQGDVLIHGLGLGMVLGAVLKKPEVRSVTVVELSQDVVDLVWPVYAKDKRAKIIVGSAYDWPIPKGVRWDAAWHDIWDGLCADNLPEMAKLCRRFGRRVDWQGCWGREEIRYNLRRRGW